MADLMWQTAKHEGVGNVVMEQVPIPEPGDNEVVARTQVSLISRGSEMGGRYLREELVDPGRMGYSTTGGHPPRRRRSERVCSRGPGGRDGAARRIHH